MMSARRLGIIGMLASPGLLLAGLHSGFQAAGTERLNALLGLVFLIGWACSLQGLRTLRAAGDTRGPLVLGVANAGVVLAACQQAQDFAGVSSGTFYRITDAAWPLTVMFMFVVGGFTMAASRLEGWRRLTPMLCGLALSIFVLATPLVGPRGASATFAVYTTIAWALMGFAVYSAQPPAEPAPVDLE